VSLLRAGALAALVFSVANTAHAAITQLSFTGTGRVTFAQSGSFPAPVAVGDLVQVSGLINLGDGSQPDLAPIIPDGFTGTVELDRNALDAGYQFVTFKALGGGVSGNSNEFFIYGGAVLHLLGGHLHSFDIFFDYEPGVVQIDTSTFGYFSTYGPGARWGGVWDYDQPDSMIPEPATWGLLIAGFGLAGAALRRRRLSRA